MSAVDNIVTEANRIFRNRPVRLRIENSIVAEARRNTRSRRNDWPGTPVSQLPLCWSRVLQNMVREGRVELVEVVRPSRVDPSTTRTVTYVRAV